MQSIGWNGAVPEADPAMVTGSASDDEEIKYPYYIFYEFIAPEPLTDDVAASAAAGGVVARRGGGPPRVS